MTDSNYYAGIIETADFFVDSRRKSEATEVINMLRNALVRHIGESQTVIDEHMKKVANRVLSVFEEIDEDTLAEEISSEVFEAIGLLQAFGAHPSQQPDVILDHGSQRYGA